MSRTTGEIQIEFQYTELIKTNKRIFQIKQVAGRWVMRSWTHWWKSFVKEYSVTSQRNANLSSSQEMTLNQTDGCFQSHNPQHSTSDHLRVALCQIAPAFQRYHINTQRVAAVILGLSKSQCVCQITPFASAPPGILRNLLEMLERYFAYPSQPFSRSASAFVRVFYQA